MFFDSLIKGFDLALIKRKKFQEIQNGLIDMQKEANKGYAEEQTHLKNLVTSIKNESLSREQRLKYAKELQELYPKIFGNMSLESILTTDLTDKYNLLTKAIRAKTASAIEGKMTELQTSKLDAELETKKKVADYIGKAKLLEKGGKIGLLERAKDDFEMVKHGIEIEVGVDFIKEVLKVIGN